MKKLITLMMAVMFVSCSVKDDNTKVANSNVPVWNEASIYPTGSYVRIGNELFKSTTKTKGVNPRNNLSSQENPLGAWRRTSYEARNLEARKLRVALSSDSDVRGTVSLADISTWEAGTVYHGNDLVRAGGNYFKNTWWNQDQTPVLSENKNNFTDSSGVTHWGPWVPLTPAQALEELEKQQGSIKPPTPEPTPDPNPTPDPTPNPNPNPTPNPGGQVSEETIAKFQWSKTAVYLENDLATLNSKFYRSKWWNQDENPSIVYAYAWDSPWEEISEGRFAELLESGSGVGPTPPPVKPDPPVVTPDPNPQPPVVAPEYSEIHKKGYIQEWTWEELPQDLKDAFNAAALKNNDIFAVQDGSEALRIFESKIGQQQWEQLFPRRRGSKGWLDNNPGVTGVADYYSYENFKKAMLIIGEYAYLIDKALDPATGQETFFERNYVLHKPSRKVRLISQSDDYFAPNNDWLINRPYKKKVVDYAAFGFEGSDNDKKRVVAGFLAHASHETSGSWATAPGYDFDRSKFPGANFPEFITTTLPGELAWSLYFNEEVSYAGTGAIGYVQAENKIFPPTPGKSYHGRGAFQLSWNYNYGLASAIFFGDSNVLLDSPEMIINGGTIPSNSHGETWRKGERIEGGTMALLSSLMFWLTPQAAKPSQQDTMILNRADGRYVNGVAKLTEDRGRGIPGYGWTINIMNGGFEADKSWEVGHAKFDAKVARRVKHYTFFTKALGGNNDGEVLDTVGKHSY